MSAKVGQLTFVFFFISGCAFLIGGIYLVSYQNTRVNDVSTYDETVDAWSDRWRFKFEQSKFLVSVLSPDNTSTHVAEAVSTGDELKDGGDDIHQYEVLRYEVDDFIPDQLWEVKNITFNVSLVEHETMSTPRNVMITLPLMTTQTVRIARKTCVNEYGSAWEDFHCTHYMRLSEICIMVEFPENNADVWIDTSTEPKGCVKGNNKLALYRRIDKWLTQTQTLDPETNEVVEESKKLDFSEIKLTLRSEHDPYLAAEEITHNNLNFGLTRSQQNAIGCLVIAIGLIQLILPVAHFFNIWSRLCGWEDETIVQDHHIRSDDDHVNYVVDGNPYDLTGMEDDEVVESGDIGIEMASKSPRDVHVYAESTESGGIVGQVPGEDSYDNGSSSEDDGEVHRTDAERNLGSSLLD